MSEEVVHGTEGVSGGVPPKGARSGRGGKACGGGGAAARVTCSPLALTVQAAVRTVVVAVDVAADVGPSLVAGLVFVQPDLPFFEFPEPALDERLGFGVAVAAAAMADLELAEPLAEAASGERRPVIGAEGQLARLGPVRLGVLVDDGALPRRRGSAG